VRTGGQAEAAVAEHPPRPRRLGQHVDHLELVFIDAGRQFQIEHEFVRRRPDTGLHEACLPIQMQRRAVLGRHQQPDPAASANSPHLL
jgi:hypothetical protein